MRTTGPLALLLSLTALAACGSTTRGGNGTGVDGGGGGGGGDGGGGSGGGSGCSTAAQFVYVVDMGNTLSKFDPTTKTFTDIGTLPCNSTLGGSPFSMGVDRNANAYVLYDTGELFQVTGIASGTLSCSATTWSSSGNLTQFGMGFSTTDAGGSTDQLFVAGGTGVDTSTPAELATIDVTSYQATSVGTVQGWPELTGNSKAELWGFFPDATHPRIDNLNKTSGAALSTYSLSSLRGTPTAWAFAAYGGDLWVFLMKDSETATTVYQIGGPDNPGPGTVKSTTPTNSRVIVGAGVSTCAPVVLM